MFSRAAQFLDNASSGLIRIAYLLATVVATGAYFADGTTPRWIVAILGALLPWVLAFAVETHSYLTARRVRGAWQDLQASATDSEEHDKARASMKINLAILAGLLAFSSFNQAQYLASTWTPPHTSLSLPGPLAYVVRALVIPVAFMAAAFLTPMGESLSSQITTEAHHVAAATFKVARKQWKKRLQRMEREGQDVTRALVQLVDDPRERAIIETIYGAMYPDAQLDAQPAASVAPTPPTDGGTPLGSSKTADDDETQESAPRVLRLPNPGYEGAERKVRAYLKRHPEASIKTLARALRISESTASKYRRIVVAEQEARAR